MSSSSLHVRMRHQVGVLRLDAEFTLTSSWTVLFGASGSGKTTVLRTIAGFVQPNEGRVVLNERSLVDTERRQFIPAYLRGVRCAGQTARLFDGMTVRENLEYGASAEAAEAMVELFRLGGFLEKRTEVLSGGERQRVSVARAVASASASEAGLLLLDEPFAGMDFALRDEIGVGLRAWMAERRVPVLSVTHDVGEAFLLEAEVLRLVDGRVVAQGPVKAVLAVERERMLRQMGS